MPDVYRPDGSLLARGVQAAARLLRVSRQAVYTAADPAPDGWRLRYLPTSDGSARARVRVVLWDGRQATGWRAAATLTGETQGALKMRRTRRADGWYVRARGTA